MSVVRILLGLVFLAAGALKALQPAQTVLGVGAYGLLPAPVALAGGLVLPGFEAAVGAALLAGFLPRGAAAAAAALSLVFLAFVGSAWLRGIDVSCGCFGPLGSAMLAGWATVAFDVLLLLASLAVWKRTPLPT